MMSLINEEGLRKILRQKTISGQNLDHSQVLETVSIVVVINNIDNVQLMARNVQIVEKRTILQKISF